MLPDVKDEYTGPRSEASQITTAPKQSGQTLDHTFVSLDEVHAKIDKVRLAGMKIVGMRKKLLNKLDQVRARYHAE